MFTVDGTIPNLAAIATRVSVPASTWDKCQYFVD
jgi:hypothetical protein